MANVRSRAVLGQLQSLYHSGTVSGLSDSQLLERFHSRRGAMAEAAFEALVERHGAMVLGVCRRILSDPHDADDAFQATFLILVRRAGSVRVDDSLGRWLYGVSYRVALRAKTQAARRRRLEERVAAKTTASTTNDLVSLDVRTVLDEELGRLPEKYRAPVILCHLQGLSQDETARVLGWPLGTVQGRLARARETLRDRLTRRGLTPSSTFSIAGLFAQSPSGMVPYALRHRTVQAVMRRLVGEAALAGTGSASAIALAEGVGGTMVLTKLKFASMLVLLGVIGVGTTVLPQRATAEQRTSPGKNTAPVASKPAQGAAKPGTRSPNVESKARLKVVQQVDAEKVAKGKQVRVRISVTNTGDGPARDVIVQAKLSPGLRADANGSSDKNLFEIPLGTLLPGQHVPLDPLVADAVIGGTQWCKVDVTSPDVAQGAKESRSTKMVTVIEPKLAVTLVGPRQRDPATIARYAIMVANPGTATARNVRVQVTLPVNTQLVKLPTGAKFDIQSRRLTWAAFPVEPGEKEKVNLGFELRMGSPNAYHLTVQAVGDQGLNAKEMNTTNVGALADLALEITEDRRVIDVDQFTTLTISVKNKGSKAATQILLSGRHSPEVRVIKTAGTEEPARYKQDSAGKAINGEFVFPLIERLEVGKEIVLVIQVQALEAGLATCHVSLSHAGNNQPLEEAATFKVTQSGEAILSGSLRRILQGSSR